MHSHTLTQSPQEGKTYTCFFNSTPLYDAVVERTQGCWATVKILQPHPGKYEKNYSPGQALDIKVQYYEFVEKK